MRRRKPLLIQSSLTILGLVVGTLCVGAVAYAGDTLLEIPVRWCAIKGSTAADNPGALGEPDTDNVLWRRHERASDRVWLRQGTNITFRSAFTHDILTNANFPIIDDPNPSGPGTRPGDILDPNLGDKSEFEKAKNACAQAWAALAAANQVSSLLGPIALNVRKLVKLDGTESLQGYGEASFTAASSDANCANPPTGLTGAAGALAISDYFFLRAFDPDETILAHEFGHTLGLEHGNGFDDNSNGRFDGYNNPGFVGGCDSSELENATPSSLMTPGVNAEVITPLQKGKARAFGAVYSGAVKDPPAALINGDTVGDAYVDAIHDVTIPSIDITEVTVANHRPSQTTTFSHGLIDRIPQEALNQYLVFADLDNNPNTGGAPADLNLGVPTAFKGVELVTRVVVFYQDGLHAIPTVWKFNGVSFEEVTDSSIQASVYTVLGGEAGQPQFDVVSIKMSDTVRGPAGTAIRIQAFAQVLPEPPGPKIAATSDPSPFDRVPDGATPDSGVRLNLVPPRFPACVVTPAQVRPGVEVNVAATDLVPNSMAKVILGDLMVAGTMTDANGNLSTNFVVPSDTQLGQRLVTVGSVGTALTADCSVDVEGTPVVRVPVPVDVNPTSCPNPLNVGKQGRIPVAILGTSTLDVTQIDPASIRLQGVAPGRFAYQDVATPFSPFVGKTGANACTTAGPDGFIDLVLTFDATQVSAALGSVTNNQVRTLHLTGYFLPQFGGAPIVGEDVVVIKTK